MYEIYPNNVFKIIFHTLMFSLLSGVVAVMYIDQKFLKSMKKISAEVYQLSIKVDQLEKKNRAAAPKTPQVRFFTANQQER